MQVPVVDLETSDTEKVPLDRVLAGQVYVVRRPLQRLGLFDLLRQQTLDGIRQSAGASAAESVAALGFERIHEVVDPKDLPEVTDAVYRRVAEVAREFLLRYIPGVFGHDKPIYYERTANVRFHYPFHVVRAHRRQFNEFAKSHGQGKIVAHGPHRDYWLDCPDNAVNHWVAMGRVKRGNGLSIFHEHYDQEFEFGEDGNLRREGSPLRAPLNFDLEPGDTLVFHANHLHASELNRTDETRYVISFRMVFSKPNFPEGHHHEYIHSGWAGGGALKRMLATAPAYMQPSYAADRMRRVARKLGMSRGKTKAPSDDTCTEEPRLKDLGRISVLLKDLPIGTVRAVARDACLIRLSEDQFMACGRKCPHEGADLARGFVREGQLVCPWHNLPFDGSNGDSECEGLGALRLLPIEISDGQVVVTPDENGDREPKG